MNNCRNCKWANWARNESGRIIQYESATCEYPMPEKWPAARWELANQSKRTASVWRYLAKDVMECATFEKKETQSNPVVKDSLRTEQGKEAALPSHEDSDVGRRGR